MPSSTSSRVLPGQTGHGRKVAIWPPEAWFQFSIAVLSSTAAENKNWSGRLLGSHAVANLGLPSFGPSWYGINKPAVRRA
jgi:hypothetical protein